jgi:hypothetical protein
MIQEIIVVIDDTLYCLERVIIDILLCLLVFSLLMGETAPNAVLLRGYWEVIERLLRGYLEVIERLLRGYWEVIERLLRGY